jgi:hypothetical protein
MTNLTRRDWLKSSALCALALALGLWPDGEQPTEESMPVMVGRGSVHLFDNLGTFIYFPEQEADWTDINIQVRVEGMEEFERGLYTLVERIDECQLSERT